MEIAVKAAEAGLSGFCITDHDTVAGHAEIQAAMETTGLLIIPGIEVTTAVGHVLAIGCREPVPRGLGLEPTCQAINKQGGVAIAAHPLRFMTGMGPNMLADAAAKGIIHAAEAINARERPLANNNTAAVVAGLDLVSTGGSDAHWIKEIGTACTVFERMPTDVADAVSMIQQGLVSATGRSTPRRSVVGHQISLSIPPLRRRVVAKLDKRRRKRRAPDA